MKTVRGQVIRQGGGAHALDKTPIVLAGWRLRARSAVPVGRPTADQTASALAFACASHEGSPLWIGDILNYCDSREDWAEQLDQIKAVTGLAHQTILNACYVARHVPEDIRQFSPSPAHTAEVATLDHPEQRKFLDKASREGWTRRELRVNIRAAKRPRVIEGQAALEGMFRVIYADCPWKYDQHTAGARGSLSKAADHYPPMTLDELKALPVEAHSLPDSILFGWATVPLLPEALEVFRAWGFTYKTHRVWHKVLGNPGSYGMQVEHELLIIGTRGSCLPEVPTPHDHSIETIRRSDTHSEKPEEFRQFITRHWTSGPYLELFGRKPVEGWSVFGNDPRLWGQKQGAA